MVVVTMKVALAESPVLPFTVTIYAPGVAVPATLKLLPDNWPVAVIVHVDAGVAANRVGPDGVCINGRHVVSTVLNPLPVILTAVVMGPEFGERVICGPVTTKLADAISPVLPFTETT
jgi:hypothetical protein